eukprot:11244944-Prorocentrum_lima.AAC.1
MTSSLVGSEMCIRDSKGSVHTLGLQSSVFLVPAGRAWMAVPQVAWSVSYTHLTLPTICSV